MVSVSCSFATFSSPEILVTVLYLTFFFVVKSFVEMVWYIFTTPGITIFYSNWLCQDSLENLFGQIRQRGRTHESQNVDQFLKNVQALHVINATCATVRGNCRAGDVDPKHEKKCHQMQIEKNAPLKKCPRNSKRAKKTV